MRRSPTLLSFTIAASLICAPIVAPTPAQAAPLGATLAPAEAADPAIAEAQSLYNQGKDKFDTAEYEDALALWKRAFEILPDGEETRGIRHALVYNIANAHSQAYEVSRNPTHLRKAKILLENYRAQHRELYGDEKAAVKERAEVDDRLAELEKLIAESEAAGEKPTPLAEPGDAGVEGGEGGVEGGEGTEPPPVPQPTPKPMTPREQWQAEVNADPELGPKWAYGQKKLVGGSVLVGIGGIFTLISIGTFVVTPIFTEPGLFSGRIAGFVAGGIFGAIGLGMLIPGAIYISRGSKARNEVLSAKPRPAAFLAPSFSPRGGGLTYTLRF